MVTNPRAVDALMQIQTGLSTLQQESPNLFSKLVVDRLLDCLLRDTNVFVVLFVACTQIFAVLCDMLFFDQCCIVY